MRLRVGTRVPPLFGGMIAVQRAVLAQRRRYLERAVGKSRKFFRSAIFLCNVAPVMCVAKTTVWVVACTYSPARSPAIVVVFHGDGFSSYNASLVGVTVAKHDDYCEAP